MIRNFIGRFSFVAAALLLVSAIIYGSGDPRVAYSQFSDQSTWAGTSGGSANAQTITIANYTANLAGVPLRFKAGFSNSGATTLVVTGLSPVAIQKQISSGLSALTGGEIVAGLVYAVVYDGSIYQLINSATLTVLPTQQVFLSGSSLTYTTPTGARKLLVKMIGGGGGGAATVTNNGVAGTASSFNGITAAGGGQGISGSGSPTGGTGGTGGTGSANFRLAGGDGFAGGIVAAGIGNDVVGGQGGSGFFGGGGRAGVGGAGNAGKANTGAGGGGGGASGGSASGGGGASGEYLELTILSPSGTYTYTVGPGGNGGAAGTFAGGAGGIGIITVDEFYNRPCWPMPANDNIDQDLIDKAA